MEITPAAPPPRRDLTIRSGVIDTKVYLLPGQRTRTGTPLTWDRGGWRVIRPNQNETAFLFAAGPSDGGENVQCFKAVVVDTHTPSLEVGRVKIVDVQDSGIVTFVNDDTGPYVALTKSVVFLG